MTSAFDKADDLNLGQWENHSSARRQIRGFALEKIFPEMPWEYKECVRPKRVRLLLGNNRDQCARGVAAELVRINLSDRRQFLGSQAAELQDDIAFGGSTVAQNLFSPLQCRLQRLEELVAVPKNPVAEMLVHGKRSKVTTSFIRKQLLDSNCISGVCRSLGSRGN